MFRQQRRKVEDDEGEHHGFDASSLREHEEFTKVKNVERIELGRFEMETWYFSPLPPEFKDCKVSMAKFELSARSPSTAGLECDQQHSGSCSLLCGPGNGMPYACGTLAHSEMAPGVQKLYFVEGDLSFFKHRSQMLQHLRKCKLQHPPGDEIYRNGNVSMFEVDGKVPQCPSRPACSPMALQALLYSPGHAAGTCNLLLVLTGSGKAAADCTLAPASRASRWLRRRRSCTARTCATWPSCSWTTKPCTMTWTSSSSTSCASAMSGAPTLSGEQPCKLLGAAQQCTMAQQSSCP